jgi:hypothetical protein
MAQITEDTYQLVTRQVQERYTVSFPKHTVIEVGAEPGGPIWQGKVRRVRHFTRQVLGGRLVELTLDGVTMSNRPGASYDCIQVVFLADEAIAVHPRA